MKKILVFVFCIVLLISGVACKANKDHNSNSQISEIDIADEEYEAFEKKRLIESQYYIGEQF